ncbi:hypothetical protein DLM20_24035 [Salmonella enterica subsp. enterica serovar Java]|nr:hypothetical protein [Salmonella enterica subsp. enterica serovar Java]
MQPGRKPARRRWIVAAAGLAGLTVVAATTGRSAAPETAVEPRVTLVRVEKSARTLKLMAGDVALRTFPVALGGNPLGHKEQEGDMRTPEGRYVLDWRNPKSGYYRSIHISYPDEADLAPAGGDIMIHGQPNGYGGLASILQLTDWTHGCIAVTNEHMAQIWDMVENGTPIEIDP